MTLQRTGGLAALVCAATYLFGFAFLVTVLAPLGFGTGDTDASTVVAFIDAQPGLMIVWNTVIYILNAFALARQSWYVQNSALTSAGPLL